jgi:hypothetical protein
MNDNNNNNKNKNKNKNNDRKIYYVKAISIGLFVIFFSFKICKI